MKTKLCGWVSVLVLLAMCVSAEAIVLPKAGRYRGTVTIQFATADKKNSVKQIMPAFALLLDDNTLQVVMSQIPDLPDWKTRQPQGMISIVGAPPAIPLHLRWSGSIGDQT